MNVVGLRERLGVRRVTIGRCWSAKDETVYAFLSPEPSDLYTNQTYVFHVFGLGLFHRNPENVKQCALS